jgi:hypothetical protein
MANKTNPNGANQYQLDPRQKLCWEFYIDPRSETFGNAMQSAIKAGYEPGTAEHIMRADWFAGKLRRLNMRSKAEKVLEKMLSMSEINVCVDKLGRTIKKKDTAILKIKQDTAKFCAERLGKEEWSSRQELTGADGERLIQIEQEEAKKIDNAINEYLGITTAESSGTDTGADYSEHPTEWESGAEESLVPVPGEDGSI